MYEFTTIDNKFYSVPEDIVNKFGGYFNLVSEGVIPIHSLQINFLLFYIDHFEPDEFVKSIPLFFQFSNTKLDKKILKKIHSMLKDEKEFKKKDISHIHDQKSLIYHISYTISEKSTLQDLKKILLHYFETIWYMRENLIRSRFRDLKEQKEKKDYFMTLSGFNDGILSCLYIPRFNLTDYESLRYYFGCDIFTIHFIDHFYEPISKNKYELRNLFVHCILSYSTSTAIQYLVDHDPFRLNVSFIEYRNNISGDYPIHYICKRSMSELIIYFTEKVRNDRGPSFLWEGFNYHTALFYIFKFCTPGILQYALQKMKNYPYSLKKCNEIKLPRAENQEMILFLEEIGYNNDFYIDDIIQKTGWFN